MKQMILKKIKKRFLCFLCLILVGNLCVPIPEIFASKTSQELYQERKELEEKKEENRKRAEQSKEVIDELQNLSHEEKIYLKELNHQMSEVASELAQTEEEYEEKQEVVNQTEQELETARRNEKIQYESMKKRIKFLYENGTPDLLEVLFMADSFSDFLYRTEFITKVAEYDKNKLLYYRDVKEETKKKEQLLKEQKEELEVLMEDQNEKKMTLACLVTTSKDTLEVYLSRIEEEKEKKANYLEEMNTQQIQIDDIKEQELAQKAIEDAAKRAQEQAQRTQSRISENQTSQNQMSQNQASQDQTGTQNTNLTQENLDGDVQSQSELELLAAIIECEAGGEGYDGMLAVGSVVLNRVDSSYFPDSITGVIYEEGQFQPVRQGRLAAALSRGASEICTKAAKEVLGGTRTIDKLFFKTVDGSAGTVIGNILFY